uniref:Ig-like domain-containing protein n=3 Tax=Esox lucius TaxID=8010 RepID=A0AAY5KAI5_ESOLU
MVRSQTAFLLPAVRGRSFVQQPANRTVRKGEPVTLVCRPPYSRAPSPVSWFKNNRPLTPRTHFTVRRNGDLIFRSVHDTDSGVYFCRAFDVHLNRFVNSRTARLTVLDPPSVRLWPPVVTVPVGATVVFHCQVWGLPLPSITWSKQGRSTQTGGKILVGVRNATLSIQSVRSYDEGTYTCEASNTVGHDQRKATLRVAVSPIIVFFTGAVRSSEGSSVVMPCRAVGEVPIRYIWTRGHSQASIIRTPKRHVDDDGALHISNIEVSDAGDYHCTAENRAGRQQRTVMLTISAKDNTADRDKQHSQSLYSVTNHEAEQRTPLPTVQRIETTQSNVPLQGKGSVRASPRNSSKDLTPASTLDTLRLLGSLRQSASGLTGLFGGQTRHLGPTDLHSHLLLDSANSTQRAVTQIHPPVLQPLLPPPPPPLYQPLELLRRLQVILPPTTLAYNLPPVTSQDSFPQRQYVFPQFGSPSIDNQPSIMHILYQVTDQPINPIVNLTKSLVSLQHPSTHSLDQSNDSLSQPREPVTPFLLTPTLHFDSITQNHRSVTQSPLLDPPIQHPSPLTQFSVLKINRQQHPTQTQPSQPQPKPHQIQPQTSQPPSQPHQNQPQPSQPHHKPFQTQPQQSQLHQTQPQPSQNQLQTHQTQPQPSHTLPQPHQTQPQPSQPHSQPHQNQPQPSQTHSQPHQNQPQPSQTHSQPHQNQPQQSQPHSQPHQNQPQPSQPHSQPYQTQPQPSQQSQLHQTQPQPSQNQPQTHQTQAQPSQTQSQLHQTQPQPSQPQHKPHQTQPQTQTQTEPDQGQPSQPQPQLSPTPLQPSQTQPEHTQTLPEPTRIQSKTLETLTKPSQNQSEQSQNQPEPSQNKFEQLPNQPKPTQTQPQTSQTQPELSQTQANYRLTRDPQGRSVPYTATPEPLRQNVSYPANPDHPAETTRPTDTEPTEWLKRNTSQSPMRTSEDSRVKPPPPWLPVLEKHDIPIVVGVGVSLAFIFITMAFYSLVQKNEPAPAFRVPRNMGVPCRHAERLAAGRTYENRAFEGDDLEAVIEQSPNTSDTRAVPPAPSPVAVTIDPASDETGPTSEHSVVAETYPEPSEETMVDPFLDEEKSCSLSHPSIQLQCVEDWSGGGVEHGQHQGRDVLPEPPSTSHSPSPPPEREESLRSTLTLQTAEPRLTPIHHSVSISHSNAPLLLSHCVSLGHTTVAVDVHFYPAVPASGAAAATVAAATQINANAATGRGPHLGSRVAHLQEHDQIGCRPAPE